MLDGKKTHIKKKQNPPVFPKMFKYVVTNFPSCRLNILDDFVALHLKKKKIMFLYIYLYKTCCGTEKIIHLF